MRRLQEIIAEAETDFHIGLVYEAFSAGKKSEKKIKNPILESIRKDVKKILWYFGEENQFSKLIEEITELNIAIATKNKKNIPLEIADVFNMRLQLEIIIEKVMKKYDISWEKVLIEADKKNKRTFERIEAGYYKAGKIWK